MDARLLADGMQGVLEQAIRAGELPPADCNRERFVLLDFFGEIGSVWQVHGRGLIVADNGSDAVRLKVTLKPCNEAAVVTLYFKEEDGVPRINGIDVDTTARATKWFTPATSVLETFPAFADIDREPARRESFKALGRPYKPFECARRAK